MEFRPRPNRSDRTVNASAGRSQIRFVVALAACLGTGGAWLAAQFSSGVVPGGQVNNQVNRQTGPVYQQNASIHYTTSTPLPSEVRNAYVRSGALPSEIRMNYGALGPMHPGGPLAYIPEKPIGSKPAYTPPPAAGAGAFSTGQRNTFSGGSVHYASPAPAPSTHIVRHQPIQPRSYTPSPITPRPISSGPISGGPMNQGSIRYAR